VAVLVTETSQERGRDSRPMFQSFASGRMDIEGLSLERDEKVEAPGARKTTSKVFSDFRDDIDSGIPESDPFRAIELEVAAKVLHFEFVRPTYS